MKPPSMFSVILHLSCWLKMTTCALPSTHSTETIEFEQRNSRSVRSAGTICENCGSSSPKRPPSSQTARWWKCRCCSSVLVGWQRWMKLRPSCSALTSTAPCCSGGEIVAGDVLASRVSHSSREGAIFCELMRRRVPGASERASWKSWLECEELASSCADCPNTTTNSSSSVISLFIFKIQCPFSPFPPLRHFPLSSCHFEPRSACARQPVRLCEKIGFKRDNKIKALWARRFHEQLGVDLRRRVRFARGVGGGGEERRRLLADGVQVYSMVISKYKHIMMSRTLLLTLALVVLASASLTRNTHDYWYTAAKVGATSGVPMGDVAWGYCDMKCTYLENYYPGVDFVVIPFTESVLKPNFAACYVATQSAAGTTYKLWNTVAKNSYFETNCGDDKEDYYAATLGASPKYKVDGTILGAGIGTEIVY